MKKTPSKKNKQHTSPNSTATTLPTKQLVLYAVLFALAGFMVYWSSLSHGFVRWDDDWFVYDNPYVNDFSFDRIGSLFSEFYQGQYSPVTALIMAGQYALGEGSASVFHWVSLLLHLLNTALVFRIFRRLSENDWVALLTAGMFMLHPVQVESVSWISAQKVLNFSFFFLLALDQYVSYVKKIQPRRSLLLFYLFFTLSFLAKEQAVTLALTTFGIDYLLRRDFKDKKVYWEKIPLFLLALVMGLITIYSTQSGEFLQDSRSVHFLQQLAYSSYSLLLYAYKLVLPVHLSAFYPYPNEAHEAFPMLLYLSILPVVALAYFFFKQIRRFRWWIFGTYFFLANIILVLQVMPLRDFIIADRYLYLPALGVWFPLSHYLVQWARKKNLRNLSLSIMVVLGLFYTIQSNQRSGIWESSLSLFDDMATKYPKSSIALNNRGLAYADTKQYALAIKDYKEAIALNPSSLFPYNNLGIVLREMGKTEESEFYLSEAIAADSSFAQAWFNRAETRAARNDLNGAISDYSYFLGLRPEYLKAYVSRGIQYFKQENIESALQDLNHAVDQGYGAEAYLNRGVIYLNVQEYPLAIQDFNQSLALRPDFSHVYLNRGIAYLQMMDNRSACADFKRALQLGFRQAESLLKQHCND